MSVKPLSLFVAAALLSAYARAADETPAANPQPSAETVDARDSVSAVVVRARAATTTPCAVAPPPPSSI